MLNILLQKLKRITPYLSIPLIIIGAILLVSVASPPPLQYTISNYGEFDLRGYDTENYVIRMGGVVEYIPNKLLSPDEFSSWASQNETFFGGAGRYSFVTSRIRIYVEDGKWYTFSRYSIDYSHRLFVNGQWLLDIGRPGETSETDIPNTGRITFTAQGVDGVVEIVQQSSNHVHRTGGGHLWWFVGTGTMLSDWARAEQYQTNIILGSFMVLALLFLVLFFTHGRNYANLLFSIFCFAWFMRVGVTGGRVFTVIIPWLDWAQKFRIEYIAIPISAALTLAIVNIIFKNALHKRVLKFLYCVSAAFALLFLILDTVAMRGWLDILFVIYFAAILWLLGCLFIRHWRKQKNLGQKAYNIEQRMFAVGLFLFIGAAIVDFGYVSAFFHMPNFHMTGVAVLVFALCEAAAVFTSSMNRLEEAKKNELEAIVKGQALTAENAALDSLNRMKAQYLANMSHNIKTPLAAISVDIQRAARLVGNGAWIDENGALLDERVMRSLLRAQDEIMHAARLTESALHMAAMQESRDKMNILDTAALFINNAEAYRSYVEKQGNVLKIDAKKNLPPIFGNADELMGVFTNLLTNANRHTKNGEINVHITQAQTGNDLPHIAVTVKDNGTGISPKLLPYVFERGITGADSTGIGLAISKKTVETHGGEISVTSEPGKGTEVTFTIPIYNKERQGGEDEEQQ